MGVFPFLLFFLVSQARAETEGSITSVFQWYPGGNEAQLNISSEISSTFQLGKGRITARAGMQRGDGICTLNLLSNPCGATSGPNASVESWSEPESIHLLEAKADLSIMNGVSLSLGHLDLTGYFDTNKFANDEKTQFLAYLFTNNISVDWGGDLNFYGPGAVLSFQPLASLNLLFGGFDGDGDYKDILKNPFLIGELGLTLSIPRERNIRIYFWTKRVRRALGAVEKGGNSGLGVSLDYEFPPLGLFSRIGFQDKDVSEIFGSFSFGALWNGPFGRGDDSIGLGIGINLPSNGDLKPERYLEAFYRISLSEKISITPDIQAIVSPAGGDGMALVVGIRGRFEM